MGDNVAGKLLETRSAYNAFLQGELEKMGAEIAHGHAVGHCIILFTLPPGEDDLHVFSSVVTPAGCNDAVAQAFEDIVLRAQG